MASFAALEKREKLAKVPSRSGLWPCYWEQKPLLDEICFICLPVCKVTNDYLYYFQRRFFL